MQENMDEVPDMNAHEDQEYPYQEDVYSQNLYAIGDSIARRVEQEKLAKIYYDSHDLKQKLAIEKGRCEICTLKPPCKHYKEQRVVEEQPAAENMLYTDNSINSTNQNTA